MEASSRLGSFFFSILSEGAEEGTFLFFASKSLGSPLCSAPCSDKVAAETLLSFLQNNLPNDLLNLLTIENFENTPLDDAFEGV
jgi:hypothetical protein